MQHAHAIQFFQGKKYLELYFYGCRYGNLYYFLGFIFMYFSFAQVGGCMFRLEVYPSGFSADTKRHVSVFLTTPNSLNFNHVLHEISILDQVRHAGGRGILD